METLTIDAYAKVNLGLDVVRRLENGYHEVKMIMQTVGIFDTLILTKQEKGIQIITDSGEIPANEDNLIYKAAKLLQTACGIEEGVSIELRKRIPVAAGMAGGSTDAAAVLKGMNQLFALGLSEEQLQKEGVKLGADIPYCIIGGTALSEGIGEQLTKLPSAPDCFVLVAKPDISVSTKYVYQNLQLEKIDKHPDIDGMVAAIKAGSLKGVTDRMDNVLETVTQKEYPVIGALKDFMEANGAIKALMSGSGPTVFGIYEDKEKAEVAKEKLKPLNMAKQIFVTTFQKGNETEDICRIICK